MNHLGVYGEIYFVSIHMELTCNGLGWKADSCRLGNLTTHSGVPPNLIN